MDPHSTEVGYLLGQLMAVFERLQRLAIRNPNASVVDHYFGAASATPKLVFIRLYKNARHHARKVLDDKQQAGFAVLLERLVDTLSEAFGIDSKATDYKNKMRHPERVGFPSYLSLEQQGLFVLGYHHMRKWLWLSKEERRDWEAQHPDAPRAYLWSRQKEEIESETEVPLDV